MKGIEFKGNIKYMFFGYSFINLQCRYIFKRYLQHHFSNKKFDKYVLLKISSIINYGRCKFNTQIHFPFNLLNKESLKKFHIGFYECVDILLKKINLSVFCTIAKAEKSSQIWIYEKDKRMCAQIKSPYFKIGFGFTYFFVFDLKINCFGSFTFVDEIDENKDKRTKWKIIPNIGLNIEYKF